MKNSVPKEEVDTTTEDTSCNFLLAAADWMSANSHVLDPTIMRDLKLCIRMRNRVAKSMFGGGDSGHRYFLQVLVYCWTVLRTLPTEERKDNIDLLDVDDEGEEESEQDENRFSPLYDDGEEDDMEEDEECFPSVVSRPEPVANPVSIEDLLASDDRNDAILFLLSLDELTEIIAGQYRVLVKNIRNGRSRGYPPSEMIHNLMDATIMANFAIQTVQKMEVELETQHEHLSTPCRLLSCLAFPELTAEIDSIVREHGSKECGRSEIIAFLGDSMECSFLNPSDEWNRMDSMVDDFCQTYDVDTAGFVQIEQIFKGIGHMTVLEIPIKPEINSNLAHMRATIERGTGKPCNPHSWLQNMNYIGGDRAIHRTVRLLQLFAGAIDNCRLDMKMGPAKKGMFGKLTDHPIRFSDMDEILMSHMLPSWVNMCRNGILGRAKLPRSSELSPLYLQVKSYIDNPRRSVSWSCAFSVHAVLTGMFECASEREHVRNISKTVFDHYFWQMRNCMKSLTQEKSSSMGKSPAMRNVMTISFLENFGLPAFDKNAMWNPLCAGTNISILNFFGNIDGGCALIDCQAQLRIMMYLYHGCIINGLLEEDSIPLLYFLYKRFKKCKALWHGTLPCRGELVKKFWISFGMGLKESKEMSDIAENLTRGGPVSSAGVFADWMQRSQRGRTMKPIEPSEISTAFRRICERDFNDVVDKYHTPEQRQRSSHTEQYEVAVYTNDTLDHLEDEIQFHSVNLVCAGYYLEQFICSITRIMKWDTLLENFQRATSLDQRQGFAAIFAQHLLGALDFAVDPLNHKFRNAPMLTRQAPNLFHGILSWIEMFFSRVPPTNVLWFQGMESGDDVRVELLGSGATRR